MIYDKFYKVTVTQITKGIKEQTVFERVYDSEHPKMKEPNPPNQYEYRNVIKPFEEKEVILEEKVTSIDLPKILRAINLDL